MASVNPEQHAQYQQEAGEFLTVMDEMAPQIGLDYSVDSLQRLDNFISEHFDPPNAKQVNAALTLRVGCYLGEVIIRHLGGYWNEDGKPEINELGSIEAVFPIERAQQRFVNGKQDSLSWYYHSLVKKMYEAESSDRPYATTAGSVRGSGYAGSDDGGVIGFLISLFKK